MKKAITILAVLIVLVGAVFAEDHTIRIKADVTSVIPVFALRYTYGSGEAAVDKISNTTSEDTDETSTDYLQWDNSYTAGGKYYVAAGTSLANSDAVETGLKLDKGGDVYFWAVLLNTAKEKKSYTLTFSDGQFKNVTLNSGATTKTIVPNITTDNPNTTTTNGFAVTGTGDETFSVTFDGKQVVNTDNVNGINLARGVYSYTGEPDIDMPAGTENYYYADVTLTITADNN